jgi:long-chain acyl-CoA synthetase
MIYKKSKKTRKDKKMKQLYEDLPHDHPWSKYYPKKYLYQLEDAEMPIYYWLDQAAGQFPQKASLIFHNSKLNFKLFQQLSQRFAYSLQDRGLQKGDRVILMLPNCPQFAIAFFGLLRVGIISVPLNTQFTSNELVYYLNDLDM